MKSSFSLDLRRQSRRHHAGVRRNIQMLEAADAQSPGAIRAAEKLVAACRENVRFLNRHLEPFKVWLDFPRLDNNVLYLAYTVTVKESAPFEPRDLRRALAEAGIETRPEFSFSPAGQSRHGVVGEISGGYEDEWNTFCLPCHQYLTIRDLEYIIDACESFFADIGHSRRQYETGENRGST
jgi:dTDP-4-amino-4,6-dideoxygalactose transaminase